MLMTNVSNLDQSKMLYKIPNFRKWSLNIFKVFFCGCLTVLTNFVIVNTLTRGCRQTDSYLTQPIILTAPKPLFPWGSGVCTMQPSNVFIQQVKKRYRPTSLCLEPLNVSIEQEKKMHGPTSLSFESSNVSIQQEKNPAYGRQIISQPMRIVAPLP